MQLKQQWRWLMRKSFIIGVALSCSILISPASADTVETRLAQTVRGTVVDEYKKIIRRTPYTVEVCTEGQVGDKTADTLLGALIGGAIGNNVTKNLPDGGTAGAIIGGFIGNMKSSQNVGPVCQRVTRYNENTETIYSHSIITFSINGRQHRLKYTK
jgi:uncharacterized protein YcfJ